MRRSWQNAQRWQSSCHKSECASSMAQALYQTGIILQELGWCTLGGDVIRSHCSHQKINRAKVTIQKKFNCFFGVDPGFRY